MGGETRGVGWVVVAGYRLGREHLCSEGQAEWRPGGSEAGGGRARVGAAGRPWLESGEVIPRTWRFSAGPGSKSSLSTAFVIVLTTIIQTIYGHFLIFDNIAVM